MHNRSEKQHAIDFIFPIALFFVFIASSLIVVLLAASGYQKTVEGFDSHYKSRTSLDYVTEKIRQGDEKGAVSIGTFDGRQSLIIRQSYDGQDYVTYTYEDEGFIKELFIQEGAEASASAGTAILEASSFDLSLDSDGCFRLSVQTPDGREESAVVMVRTGTGKGGASYES